MWVLENKIHIINDICQHLELYNRELGFVVISTYDVWLRAAASFHPVQGPASTGLILGLYPANGRRRYKVTPSLIGWAQTSNQSCSILDSMFDPKISQRLEPMKLGV